MAVNLRTITFHASTWREVDRQEKPAPFFCQAAAVWLSARSSVQGLLTNQRKACRATAMHLRRLYCTCEYCVGISAMQTEGELNREGGGEG